jgi:methylglyoxal/glyoxal reductase
MTNLNQVIHQHTFSVRIVVKAILHSWICLVDRINLRSEYDSFYYMLLTLESRAKLNNGIEIPRLGLGVYQSPPGEITLRAVRYALKIGYRHIDTAELYGNEMDVGRAVQESGIRRDDIFITTKVWNSHQGYDSTLYACEGSLRRLGLSYVDLYLIHWPVQGLGDETWKAMTKLLHQGKARAIGVSNYSIRELNELLDKSDVVVPAVNQVEFHPFLYQEELLRFCKNNKIQLEAYSPLTRGKRLNHPNILELAKKYNKTPSQILIRLSLQHDIIVIPKSIHEARIKENSQVFDFQLEPNDMKLLNSLNENLHTIFMD